ncbi:MAG: DNA-directed RNA polymerase subunit RPC12/RpoP [Bacteroidia bacterium]|jgi:DNA-directed RNA polymerase subunit RPC12/RpoP
MSEQQSTCFTCGRDVGSPPQLNRLENGLPCPNCRDRVLDFLPPILPGPGSRELKPGKSEQVNANGLTVMSPIYEMGPDEPA